MLGDPPPSLTSIALRPARRRHYVLGELAELLLEFLGWEPFGPVNQEVLKPGCFAAIDLMRSITSAVVPQNQAFCATPSFREGVRAGG